MIQGFCNKLPEIDDVDRYHSGASGEATTHDLVQTFSYNPAGQIASVSRSNDAYAWSNHYGATADRVMAHLESFRANAVDAPAVYMAISRAKDAVALYTDSRARLTEALGLRDGAQIGAIDGVRQNVRVAVG